MKDEKHRIDAVKMMREIRDKLSEKYLLDPKQEMLDLEQVRKKYKLKVKSNKSKV
jgi:hypothetical protein